MATGWPMKTTYADGDVYSASDVNDTNGTVNLLTSSTLSLGAGKNLVINGGFDVWQRGTSVAAPGAANTWVSDRWRIASTNNAQTISRQAVGDTTNLPNIQYCARVSRNSGQTGTGTTYFTNSSETTNAIPYAGKAVTFSFYARKGATFSGTFTATLYSGTGTDQNWADVSYTGQASVATGSPTLTTTWTRYTYTGTVAATATELALVYFHTPTGTAGATDYFEVTGVQIELGSTATTFSRAGGTIQGELAACQRYYYRNANGSTYNTYGVGISASTSQSSISIPLPVIMRIAPTSVDYSTLGITDAANYQLALTALTMPYASPSSVALQANTAASQTALRTALLTNQNSTAGFLGFSAEL
jgi:hypothetical protein